MMKSGYPLSPIPFTAETIRRLIWWSMPEPLSHAIRSRTLEISATRHSQQFRRIALSLDMDFGRSSFDLRHIARG
jgi:hypothetical protein